jgi:sugar lactone lactonase YvrE
MISAVKKSFGSSVLLWFRQDLSRDAVRAHWRGPHAQLVARTPGFLDYRQHHFATSGEGAWPPIAGVETIIPAERRIDGMPEVILDGLTAPLRGRKHQAPIHADEANAFARTILYVCSPGSGRIYDLTARGRVGARSVILLRKRGDAAASAFARFVRDKLSPAISADPSVRELRVQVFMPWRLGLWDTPGVAHDNPAEAEFHASLVLGFGDESERARFFASAIAHDLAGEITQYCTAVHAYDVEQTHIYVKDGRVTLPQVGPQPKPPLDPVKRKLAPHPPRAMLSASSTPFPPARTIPLSGPGAEDVVADAEGRLVCGLADGRIVRVDPQTGEEETIGNTGGRPLGLEVLGDGRILVCDAKRGLLRLDTGSSEIETLVSAIDDIPLRFCSNVAAAPDGSYWFTESTSRFDFEHYLGAMMEHRPSGRLFRRTPDGKVEIVCDQLHFPNGLTIVDNGAALVFAETDGYRLTRLELTGTQAGRFTVIADNLPGFADNLSSFRDGRFWVAMVGPRNASLDRAGTLPGALRRSVWSRMNLSAPVEGTTWAMAYDANGTLVADIQTQRSDFFGATGVAQVGDRLYLAAVEGAALLDIHLA